MDLKICILILDVLTILIPFFRVVEIIKIKTNPIKDLKKTILAGDNLIPTLIKCVKSDCTLGEISDQMRSVYGEHNGF